MSYYTDAKGNVRWSLFPKKKQAPVAPVKEEPEPLDPEVLQYFNTLLANQEAIGEFLRVLNDKVDLLAEDLKEVKEDLRYEEEIEELPKFKKGGKKK